MSDDETADESLGFGFIDWLARAFIGDMEPAERVGFSDACSYCTPILWERTTMVDSQ